VPLVDKNITRPCAQGNQTFNGPLVRPTGANIRPTIGAMTTRRTWHHLGCLVARPSPSTRRRRRSDRSIRLAGQIAINNAAPPGGRAADRIHRTADDGPARVTSRIYTTSTSEASVPSRCCGLRRSVRRRPSDRALAQSPMDPHLFLRRPLADDRRNTTVVQFSWRGDVVQRTTSCWPMTGHPYDSHARRVHLYVAFLRISRATMTDG